ncbi:hypothetical protein [Streptomyces sp. SID1034]|uniref:hypothetical protein n=1 Tax=Streptomyces sp. SID1034 TaxID=2690248 RepID=UPI001926B018|nr:hypothetical protein [Streptomyces sp. SID1034]
MVLYALVEGSTDPHPQNALWFIHPRVLGLPGDRDNCGPGGVGEHLDHQARPDTRVWPLVRSGVLLQGGPHRHDSRVLGRDEIGTPDPRGGFAEERVDHRRFPVGRILPQFLRDVLCAVHQGRHGLGVAPQLDLVPVDLFYLADLGAVVQVGGRRLFK